MTRYTFPRRLPGMVVLAAGLCWPLATPAQQPNTGSLLPLPRLGSVFPSGGKAGTTVEVTFRGADLEDAESLWFSHPGIKAEPIETPPPPPDPKKPAPNPPPKPTINKFKVTIGADVPLGQHDVRLVNRWGVSNPRAFTVGDLSEVLEVEPNDDTPQAQRIEPNVVVNGAMTNPTDVDYFTFAGKKGERVLVICQASSIDSRFAPQVELYDSGAKKRLASNRGYDSNDALIDLTLPCDGDYTIRLFEFTHLQGNADHFYRLTVTTGPWIDAVFPPIVQPGTKATLTVHGRNLPGGKPDPSAMVDGRTLDQLTVTLDVPNDPAQRDRLAFSGRVSPVESAEDGFEYRLTSPTSASNPVLLRFARSVVVLENDDNDAPEKAQKLAVPCDLAGRIDKPRDVDWYAFDAKKGDILSIEILSERLGCPTDLVAVVHDPQAKRDLVELDDHANTDTLHPFKFFTRNSDPARYRFIAPADGTYQVAIRSQDGLANLGPRQQYVLRIAPERPDFRLIVMPTDDRKPETTRLFKGAEQYLTVLAWRQDGFNGPIELNVEGLPQGVTCTPQVLGTGMSSTSLVLSATSDATEGFFPIKIVGRATIGGQQVVHEARPAGITWPVPENQNNIPAVARLERGLLLCIREGPPYRVEAEIECNALVQGEKTTVKVKVSRFWPDFKGQLLLIRSELPQNLTLNNNQPLTLPPDKAEGTLVLDAKSNAPPGVYNVVIRAVAAIPYNKDPMAKQKPPLNVVLPTTPLTVTVLPKQLANLTISATNVNVKAGGQAEITVKVTRLHDFADEFRVHLVVPANVAGVFAEEVVIPAGQNEAKLVVKAAEDAAPGNRTDLLVKVTGMYEGKHATTSEVKIAVNVAK